MTASYTHFMRNAWPQKQQLMLWVNSAKGYMVQISSVNKEQGYPMNQDVWLYGRVYLLLID
jgi:ribosomal protein S6E (S10)